MARQTRSEATRRKLLDAAIEVFTEVGCVGTARASIIERAGVTKGALYHHFETMEALVAEMMGAHHQYPDGAVLYLGTMFAPIEDRDAPGQGFTHHLGDVVSIASEKLGTLTNVVTTCDQAPPWTFGTGALMRNLAKRGLL